MSLAPDALECRIAIDFGTSRTNLAYVALSGRVEFLRFGGAHERVYVPSLFCLPPDTDEIMVGEAAEDMLEQDGIEVTDALKRQLRERRIRANGRSATPAELVRHMLRELRDLAGEEIAGLGGVPSGVVLTVPAMYGPQEADLMRDQGRRMRSGGLNLAC